MPDINLDNVANEAMGNNSEAVSEPAKDIQTATATVNNPEAKPITNSNNSNNQQPKLSRAARAERELAESRSHFERQRTEDLKRIAEFEKQIKEFEPLKPYLTQFQQQQAQIQKQGIQERFQKAPLELMQEMIDQRLQQTVQPLQQTIQNQQASEFINRNISGLKAAIGEEHFNKVAPVMSQFLDEVRTNVGKNASNLLVQNPKILFHIVNDMLREREGIELKQQQIVTNEQNKIAKDEVERLNSGITKPNRIAKPVPNATPQQKLLDAVKSLGL